MLILLDIGNTRSKYVEINNGKSSAINYCENKQLNEHWLTQMFEHASELILANVNADALATTIERWAKSQNISFQLLKTTDQQFELTCGYPNPSQLGIDRWIAMLGASLLFPNKACLVIDAGTATTIDVISPQSQHLGGWILPGIAMIQQSLKNKTHRIIADKNEPPSITLGKTTSECVNNGTWAVTVGAIELQHKNISMQYPMVETIITGGNCHEISSQLSIGHHIIDDLIFIGMQRFSD